MPPTALLTLTLLAATDPAPSAPPPPVKLEFPLAGYRIDALDSSTKPLSDESFYFTMSLPVSKFFNYTMPLPVSINSFFFKVEISSVPLKAGSPSFQDLVKDTRSYFTSHYTILLDRAPSPTEWLVEITGAVRSGQKIHAYDRWLFANGRIYRIEATTPDTQWAELGSKFKASVDSFELSSEPAPGKASFPQQGFRFSVLDGAVPVDNATDSLLWISTSVGRDVNVTVEPYAKTLKDYQAERKPPFMTDPKHKFKILAENSPAENALVTEYAEEFPPDKKDPQGFQLVTYEKVFIAHGQLYRVSAILSNESDPKAVTALKAWVDSLEAMPAPAPTPAK